MLSLRKKWREHWQTVIHWQWAWKRLTKVKSFERQTRLPPGSCLSLIWQPTTAHLYSLSSTFLNSLRTDEWAAPLLPPQAFTLCTPHPHPTHIWYIYYRAYSHTVCRQLTKGHIIVSTSAESLLKHSNFRKLIALNVAVILFRGRGIGLLGVGLNVKLQVVEEATGSKKFFPPAWKWVKQGLTCGPLQPQPITYVDLHSQPVLAASAQ